MNEKQAIKKFPLESAGKRMVENVPLAFPEERILEVRKRIFEKAKGFETLNYIYVIDKERKLVGVFSLKELLQKPAEIKVEDLMIKEIIKTHPYTDQEKVAILALKHNLKAIPVVDREEHFLGVVTSDIILEILHSEYIEDILRSAGVQNSVYFPTRVMKVPAGILAKARIPWLIVGLFGGIFAAQIANFFETSLSTHFALIVFIPLILYMGAAVGAQTQTLTTRNLAFNFEFSFKKYLSKEIKVSVLIALILGIFLSVISLLWYQLPYLGLILGVSLFLTIIAAIFIGSFIPYLLQKFKQDPAIGSGPFATIITDITSLIIYFSIATSLLKIF